MIWENIIGQKRVIGMLQRCILNQRIPQALLLRGQEGAGTVALALAFARTITCLEPIIDSDSIVPCERCKGCKQSAQLQHPNIRVVTSLPTTKGDTEEALKDDVIAEIQTSIKNLAADPYQSVRLTNASLIKIGQIRELKKTLSMSAVQVGRRIVIIVNAEDMNLEAANSFLKTLEEPHDEVTIILTTSRPERLLKTIVSRCQEIVVPPLDDDDIIRTLIKRDLCSQDEATIIAPFAQGNIQTAIDFLNEDVKALRETAVGLLRAALKGKDYRNSLMDAVNEASEVRNKTRAQSILSILSLWIRDAHAIAMAGDTVAIVNVDQREALQRFVQAFGRADFALVLSSIEEASRDLARNVSVPLVLSTAMLDVRRLFAAAWQQDRVATK